MTPDQVAAFDWTAFFHACALLGVKAAALVWGARTLVAALRIASGGR